MRFQKSFARLHAMLKRQLPQNFGESYIPAILATPQEAPRISRPSVFWSSKLNRNMHALSLGERASMLLALYNPKVFDIQEQRILFPVPAPNPLEPYRFVKPVEPQLMTFKGTKDVLQRLNPQFKHPTVKDHKKNEYDYPYVGDVLLFLEDECGAYCVNWNIKNTSEGFEIKDPSRQNSSSDRQRENALLRNELENEYYRDVGIRTQRIETNKIDIQVVNTLRSIQPRKAISQGISTEKLNKLRRLLQKKHEEGGVARDVLAWAEIKLQVPLEDGIEIYHQEILKRTIRADLYRPILIDKPCRKETRDVLSEYADWFRR